MEWTDAGIQIRPFLAVTIGIVALFFGRWLHGRFTALRDWHIPEAITGGLVFSLAVGTTYLTTRTSVSFELGARDILLVYFFTTIGMNARLSDLRTGKTLIDRHRLEPSSHEELAVGVEFTNEHQAIDALSFLHSILAIHLSVLLGVLIHTGLSAAGLVLPLFVACLFGGLTLSNLLPLVLPRVAWPSRSASVALIAEVALGVFLAMSLMSMQLWTLASLALPVLVIVAAQGLVGYLFARYALFFALGANYDAAVTSAGFVGYAIGTTPTAMASMTAVTKRHGPSPVAFLIVPLVGAVFIDLVNAIVLRAFLGRI